MDEPQALIFDIQKFSVHDGPGIRTLVFFKGCPLTCIWCSNPESQSKGQEIMFDGHKCKRFQRCITACPKGAISVNGDALALNRTECDLCGACAEACAAGAWRLVGNWMGATELLAELEKDAVFYRQSGGGVTFGGGEALLWPEMVKHVGAECKSRGYHVAVETCGYVPYKVFEEVLPALDLILYDVKHMDDESHKKLCGVSNKVILENLARVLGESVEVLVRVPVVPGMNDAEGNMARLGAWLNEHGGTAVELLPFHQLGESKYAKLQMAYECADIQPPEQEEMKGLAGVLEGYGLSVKVGS